MTKALFATMFLSVLMATAPPLAAAPSTCGSRDDITKGLSAQYKETRQGIGISGQTHVVELFVSGSGTWTILATGTNGLTCIVGVGEGWQSVPKEILGVDS